jgi:exopolysaccharide biosynthesis polyprenyl glycosylphosphotransferase
MPASRPDVGEADPARAVQSGVDGGHTGTVLIDAFPPEATAADARAGGDAPVAQNVDPRTLRVIARRRRRNRVLRRGWLVRRLLVLADLLALVSAFALTETFLTDARQPGEWAVLVAALPAWIAMAKLYGLYDRDEERADHSTVDDLVGVFHLVTVGTWLLLLGGRLTGAAAPDFGKLAGFWILAIVLISGARAAARAAARKSDLYVQNMVIVGAGDVGQLFARKVLQHPEYGINVVGFVDDHPRERRAEVSAVPWLGPNDCLGDVVRAFDVDRVVVAFSKQAEVERVAMVRSLRAIDVQIDIVPRLFDVVGPTVVNHAIEALPLVGLTPVRLSRSSMAVKRVIDVVGASLGLLVAAPLFALIAVLIRRDSSGPVLFRQVRLGLDMREFTALKFRTMSVDVDESVHREYIRRTMTSNAVAGQNGVYKLARNEVTRIGGWLRQTSLDELPQLVNVLRGEMSLVGPRPCIPYETEHFEPYHFERFLVPQGLTGLWQVAARSHSTFREALDMDVAYARAWSLGLDLRLLCRTPLEVLRRRGAA